MAGSDLQFDYTPSGIGALNAARSSNEIARLAEGRDVIFVGTAGIFGPFAQPSVYLTERVFWEPTCVRRGEAYTVKDSAPDHICRKPHPAFSQIPRCTVVCSPAISKVADLPRIVPDLNLNTTGKTQAAVENLELYSVASEIERAARSFSVLMCTTNSVGPAAHDEWKANFSKAAQTTAAAVVNALRYKGGHA